MYEYVKEMPKLSTTYKLDDFIIGCNDKWDIKAS